MSKRFVLAMLGLMSGVFIFPSVLLAQVKAVDIALDSKNFTQIDWPQDTTEAALPITWKGCMAEDVMSRLSPVKPGKVTVLPKFQGQEQAYGYLKLGRLPDNRFYFVMDVMAPDKMLMYFDFNHNGRLDDDGPGLVNEGEAIKPGEAGFATYLQVPWRLLVPGSTFKGTFKVWFFINNLEWSLKGFSHASHTFLKGSLALGGVTHTVYIHDQAENDNDADLTNDGIYFKVAEGKVRFVSRKEMSSGVDIDGTAYKFNIFYPQNSVVAPGTPGVNSQAMDEEPLSTATRDWKSKLKGRRIIVVPPGSSIEAELKKQK